MTSWKTYLATALVVGALIVPHAANAQTCTAADPNCSSLVSSASATSVLAIALPITAVGLIIYGIVTTVNNANAAHPAPQAAEMYLRQNSIELAQDLAAGSGSMVNDLAAAMELRREHVNAFGKLMREHRSELSALADKEHLNPERAAQFFKALTGYIQADPVLAPDFQAYLAHHQGQAHL